MDFSSSRKQRSNYEMSYELHLHITTTALLWNKLPLPITTAALSRRVHFWNQHLFKWAPRRRVHRRRGLLKLSKRCQRFHLRSPLPRPRLGWRSPKKRTRSSVMLFQESHGKWEDTRKPGGKRRSLCPSTYLRNIPSFALWSAGSRTRKRGCLALMLRAFSMRTHRRGFSRTTRSMWTFIFRACCLP